MVCMHLCVLWPVCFTCFFVQAEDGIRGAHEGLEFRRVLFRSGVQMIGADAEAIDKAEDRLKFREAMSKIGLESARSAIAHSVEEALAALDHTGLPAII